MKLLTTSVAAFAMLAGAALADPNGCDPGEIVIKFSHVTNTDKHPKGIAAELFARPASTRRWTARPAWRSIRTRRSTPTRR